jgi:hypothetical protein
VLTMRRALGVITFLVGVCALGAVAVLTTLGAMHPSTKLTLTVGLLGTIGAPIAVAMVASGWRWSQGPDAAALRTEAEAKRRTAAALEDAQAAEALKSELVAFVELRARRLEIDRRRSELVSAAKRLVALHDELTAAEKQLGLDASKLEPMVIEVLDKVIDRTPPRVRFSFVMPGLPEELLEALVHSAWRYRERRHLERLARIAPAAKDADHGLDTGL